MGKRDRERIERIKAGTESPISTKAPENRRLLIRTCKKCGHQVTDSGARAHIKECWGIDWPEDKPIPNEVPDYVKTKSGLLVKIKTD